MASKNLLCSDLMVVKQIIKITATIRIVAWVVKQHTQHHYNPPVREESNVIPILRVVGLRESNLPNLPFMDSWQR